MSIKCKIYSSTCRTCAISINWRYHEKMIVCIAFQYTPKNLKRLTPIFTNSINGVTSEIEFFLQFLYFSVFKNLLSAYDRNWNSQLGKYWLPKFFSFLIFAFNYHNHSFRSTITNNYSSGCNHNHLKTHITSTCTYKIVSNGSLKSQEHFIILSSKDRLLIPQDNWDNNYLFSNFSDDGLGEWIISDPL